MIYSVEGKLDFVGPDFVVVNTNGIGFKIQAAPGLFNSNSIGQIVKLYTYMHVREDAMILFGFSNSADLELFQILINVTGVGPKLGMTMLSSYDSQTIATAIMNGNESLLTSIPSLGKKIAARIVLELKDKIAEKWSGINVDNIGGYDNEVVDALMALGYSASEASFAVSNLPNDSNLTLQEKIKLSLSSFNQ